MKILAVHNAYQQPGGEDSVFEQEVRLLERHGHEVETYRKSNREIEHYSIGERLELIPKTVWRGETHREMKDLLGRVKPRVVHVHNTFMLISPSIYSACREAGVPVVQTLHNYRLLCPAATFFREGAVCEECPEHSLWRGVRYGCYRHSRSASAVTALMLAVHRRRHTWTRSIALFVAVSEFVKGKFVENGFPPGRIFVKPNFVDPDPGARSEGEGDYALYAGRLSEEKGVETLLEAWRQLRQAIPLVIAGDGPERPRLEAKAAGLSIPLVRFCGHITRQKLSETMKQARFLVFPSRWYETFGMTIVEAFACGIPVLCARLGAAQEAVEDGRTGLHFAPGDAEDLAAKADWAWTHPAEMQAMGREARCEYVAKYTAEKNYPLLIQIYEKAASLYA